MKTCVVALCIFLATCALARSSDTEELRAAVEARLPALNSYVRAVTGYETTTLPKVVLLPHSELNRAYFGDDYALKGPECVTSCPKALAKPGVIFLGTDFEPGRDDYLLVHELTHFQQFMSGKDFPCRGAMEEEAYAVSDGYVASTGRGRKSHPLIRLEAIACNRR